ncbi:MAG: cupin domain-containing protein [Nocardiopsaceae bacterium]|jgi:mannose-6-phosphate isomerase-like protein (cupin superfamily)|nr:cupin domain-containing protein [Nocardiopsaceae bacterium]
MTSSQPRGAVVQADQVPAETSAGGAIVRTLLDTGGGGPGLVRRRVDMPSRTGYSGTAGQAGEMWFVIRGTGQLEVAGQPGPQLRPDRAIWVPPGSGYQVLAEEANDLRLDTVALPEGGASEAATAEQASRPLQDRDFADCEIEMTGDRQFRVLFGPGKGCAVATQFVGEIPPGRAPEHSHPYDEVVLILGGDGTAHIGGAETPLSPGTCLHLPPGLPHCLENTGSEMLRVLGVFHPADSPASKLPAGT